MLGILGSRHAALPVACDSCGRSAWSNGPTSPRNHICFRQLPAPHSPLCLISTLSAGAGVARQRNCWALTRNCCCASYYLSFSNCFYSLFLRCHCGVVTSLASCSSELAGLHCNGCRYSCAALVSIFICNFWNSSQHIYLFRSLNHCYRAISFAVVTCDFLFFYFSSSVYSTLFLFISFGFATGLVTDTESQSQSLGCMRV